MDFIIYNIINGVFLNCDYQTIYVDIYTYIIVIVIHHTA